MDQFVPSFKLNDRVLRADNGHPNKGTIMATRYGADVYQVVWDHIGTANPPWYTAEGLKLHKEPKSAAYGAVEEFAAIKDTNKRNPGTFMVVLRTDNSGAYVLTRGILASVAYAYNTTYVNVVEKSGDVWRIPYNNAKSVD